MNRFLLGLVILASGGLWAAEAVADDIGACCYPDGSCVVEMESQCGGQFGGADTVCAGEDCQGNGVDDACDIFSGAAQDCDGNGIPDECQIVSGDDCSAMIHDNGGCDGSDGLYPNTGWSSNGALVDFTVPSGQGLVLYSCFHLEMAYSEWTSSMYNMRVRIYKLPNNDIPTDLPSLAAATPSSTIRTQ